MVTEVSLNCTPSVTRTINSYVSFVSRSNVSRRVKIPVLLSNKNFFPSPDINAYDNVPMVSGSVARIVATV